MKRMAREAMKDFHNGISRPESRHKFTTEDRIYRGGRWGTVSAAPVDMKDTDTTADEYVKMPEGKIYKGGRWGTVSAAPVDMKETDTTADEFVAIPEGKIYKGGRWGMVDAAPSDYTEMSISDLIGDKREGRVFVGGRHGVVDFGHNGERLDKGQRSA